MAEPIQPSSRDEPVAPAGTATTEVITPAETLVIETPAPPRKKRRWVPFLVLAIVAVVLVVAFVVGDALAKQYATAYVRDRVTEALELDPATPVDVDLGGGSIILQAIGGAIDEVTVDIPEMTFGDVTGTAALTATRVPLDSSKPVDTLGITLTVDEENVQKLAGFMSGMNLESITLGDGLIRVASEFEVLFFTIPVSVDLLPSAVDGGISFDPQVIMLGEDEISVADLRASPEFSALAGDLLNSRVFCVADYLPQALTIDDVDVVRSTLVVSIDGDGTAFGDPALTENGTCPAA